MWGKGYVGFSSLRASPRTTRLLALCVPTMISIALVFWNITSLGLSVWDEHTYTSTAKWFLGTKDAWFQIYEPPVHPIDLALFFKAFGIQDYAAIATSCTFAVATVALVTIVGYKWFSIDVALSAPILLSTTPLFLFFSRFALADITLTFFFSASVVATYQAMKSARIRDLVLAGVLLAITISTKYEGYLVLLIPLFYSLFMLGTSRTAFFRRFFQLVKSMIVMYILPFTAAILWLFAIGVGEILREPGSGTHLSMTKIFAPSNIKLLSFATLRAGIRKFRAITQFSLVESNRGLIGFITPFSHVPYYLQVIVTWVPIPIIVLAAVGLLSKKNLREGPSLCVSFWLLFTFLLISSWPVSFFRGQCPCFRRYR